MRFRSLIICAISFLASCNSNKGKYPIIDPLKDEAKKSGFSNSASVSEGIAGTNTTTSSSPAPLASSVKNVFLNIESSLDHTLLKSAMEACGFDHELSAGNNFTVFAPTDEAFKKLPPDKFNQLLKPENKDKLKLLIGHHMVIGTNTINDLKEGSRLSTLKGKNLTVHLQDGKIFVDGIQISSTPIVCMNGIIYSTDNVIR